MLSIQYTLPFFDCMYIHRHHLLGPTMTTYIPSSPPYPTGSPPSFELSENLFESQPCWSVTSDIITIPPNSGIYHHLCIMGSSWISRHGSWSDDSCLGGITLFIIRHHDGKNTRSADLRNGMISPSTRRTAWSVSASSHQRRTHTVTSSHSTLFQPIV